jgi:hypothetical protein
MRVKNSQYVQLHSIGMPDASRPSVMRFSELMAE